MMKTLIQQSILRLLVFGLISTSVQAQVTETWSRLWSGNQYAAVLGSYQKPDPANGAPWICLSHTTASGGAEYVVQKPSRVNSSSRITLRVYGYDDGSGTGTLVGMYNFRTKTVDYLFPLTSTKDWHSATTTTNISVFSSPLDSVRIVIVSAAADHGHIRSIELSVEYIAPPPDLTPTQLQISDVVRASPGENLDGRLKVSIKNQGGLPSGAVSFGLYISQVWRVTTRDRLLTNGKIQIADLPPDGEFSLSGSAGIQIPSDLTPGAYYLGLIVDGDSLVTESNEANNYKMIPITINQGCGDLLLSANFNSQNPGERPDSSLPGGPIGDSISYPQTNRFGGLITVQDSVSGYPNRALVIRLTTPTGLWMSFACANPMGHSQVRVSLWCSSGYGGGIALLSKHDYEIASVGPEPYSGMAYCGGNGCIHLAQTMNGLFEFAIDFEKKTTSLSIGGVPIAAAQNVPFSDTSGEFLGAVRISLGRTNYDAAATVMVFDDLIAEAVPPKAQPPMIATQPCPGGNFVITWPASTNVTSRRLYENHAVVYEGSAPSLTLNRPIGNWVYSLQEKDGCGWTGLGDSVSLAIKEAPDSPDTLWSSREMAAPGQSFTLSWDSVPGASYYVLYESGVQVRSSSDRSYTLSYQEERQYRFAVKACSPCGCSPQSRPLMVTVQKPTDVGDPSSGLPKEFQLAQNFPNPFNPGTRIGFDLPRSCRVKLEVFNVLGQKVRTLIEGPMAAGTHAVNWDARKDDGGTVSSGVYLYQLTAGDYVFARKMLLLK
jgi:hypothetical protein